MCDGAAFSERDRAHLHLGAAGAHAMAGNALAEGACLADVRLTSQEDEAAAL